ncbi:MAG: DUF4292 domain-containing protein [Saprospiraceae bacterium]|nr:DUF4292 domain-containing protein [Saprospiraceae bacterium]MCB9318058.1 DUF4292 domain-containing protein [Lewinellaceae bacterium]
MKQGSELHAFILMVLAISMLLSGFNCNRKAGKSLHTAVADEKKVLSMWDDLQHAPIEPDHLEAKSKLDIDAPDLNIGVRLHWYWAKDSLLWIRVTKIIETHRVLITPDSFKLIDNLNNEYVYGSTKDWLAKQKLPVDFDGFQRLLLGLSPDLSSSDVPALSISRDSVWVHGSRPMYEDQMNYSIHLDWPAKHIREMLFALTSGEQLAITQQQFTDAGDGSAIPWMRHYQINTPAEKYNFDLEINDWKVNQPKTVYFQIPSSYERVPL